MDDQKEMLGAIKALALLSSDDLLRKQLEEAERRELPEDIVTILRKEFWRRGLRPAA